MQKRWALLFALLSVSALCGISIAISFRSTRMALLFTAAFLVITAAGFITKARLRRRQQG